MKVVPFALLYLGSLSYFGLEAAKLDIAADFKKKWTIWALSRARRDAKFPGGPLVTGQAADASVLSLIRAQDVKGEPGMAQPSHPEDARSRVKRSRQSTNFPHVQTVRMGCRFGTCTVQKLAHQIFQLTDKDKTGSAPANKISPQGYGRRRRSLSNTRAVAPSAALESGSGGARTLARWLRSLSAGSSSVPAQPWHAPSHSAAFRGI